MNKQEAIERIESNSLNIGNNDLVVGLDVARHIISQIDEPQKVVVPKFVAEYIEYCKHEKFYTLHCAYAIMDDRLKLWRLNGNSELFAKAWLYGYEIEKEKLYTVEIPNPNSAGGKTILFKQKNTNLVIMAMLDENINKPEYLWLTEQEIRKDFEWAWQFAKEVKE